VRRATSFEIRRYGDAAERHNHDHHQIVLPLEGRLDMEIGGEGGAVDHQVAAVVSGRIDHSFASPEANRFLVVDLPEDDTAFWHAAKSKPFVALDRDLVGFCRVLAASADGGLDSLRAEIAGDLLVGSLARSLDIAPGAATDAVTRAVTFIDANLSRPLAVKDIADAVAVSASRLHDLFAERLGVPPGRYLTRRRIERARDWLVSTEMSLARIAHEAGYSDQATFTRAFRRETGTSPAQFRQDRQTRS